jgi:hypothetical protein
VAKSGAACGANRKLLTAAESAHMWATAICSLKFGRVLIIVTVRSGRGVILRGRHPGRHE